jgi:putative addiction module killer protein
MSSVRVDEYIRADGSNPFRRWFETLPAPAAAKVASAIYRLAAGNTSNVKWFAGLGERTVNWGPGYRVYLARVQPARLVLFEGGTKKTQRSDIRRAIALHAEYKARRTAARGERIRKTRQEDARGSRVGDMALTKHFKQTVGSRVRREPAFGRHLLNEAATLFLNGEPAAARMILRDLVNATMGFERLASAAGVPAKSLHRMLSARGNPGMNNIASVFCALREALGVRIRARAIRAA